MIKLKKSLAIFLVILFQTVLAVSSGLTALNQLTKDTIPRNVSIGSVDVGNLGREEAVEKIRSHYQDELSKRNITIEIEDEKTGFQINLSEIGAWVDYNATIDLALGHKRGSSLEKLANVYQNSEKKTISPVIAFNEEKLRDKMKELSLLIYREPVSANIYLKDGVITKEPESAGLRLNLNNAVNKIKKDVWISLEKPMVFSLKDTGELEAVEPDVTLKKLNGADEVVFRYSTEIKSAENLDSIKKAVKAINKVLILPADAAEGEKAGEFSFNKYLAMSKVQKEQNDEGYNQVASTLYAAVLFAGVEQKDITRVRHKSPVEYIDPGLDVKVFGNVEDFRFNNSFDNPIVVFAEIRENKVEVSLVGKKKDRALSTGISINIVQKTPPPVINVENQELEPDEKRVVSTGKEGVKVNVFRVIMKEGRENDRKLIYTDEYEPVEAIVQVGRNKAWEGTIMK